MSNITLSKFTRLAEVEVQRDLGLPLLSRDDRHIQARSWLQQMLSSWTPAQPRRLVMDMTDSGRVYGSQMLAEMEADARVLDGHAGEGTCRARSRRADLEQPSRTLKRV